MFTHCHTFDIYIILPGLGQPLTRQMSQSHCMPRKLADFENFFRYVSHTTNFNYPHMLLINTNFHTLPDKVAAAKMAGSTFALENRRSGRRNGPFLTMAT